MAFLSLQPDFHLFIDDLGKTKLTEDRVNQLFRLIDLIYEKGFKISVTTNLKLSTMEERWGEQGGGITRRLQEICKPVLMFNGG